MARDFPQRCVDVRIAHALQGALFARSATARRLLRQPTKMTAEESTIHDWLRLVQAEYLEMPGLILTKPQMQRLWMLDPTVCEQVIQTLVASDFLRMTDHDAYVLSGGPVRGARSADAHN